MGFFAEYTDIVAACREQSFSSDSQHIDFHKPELYAMLALLVNESARTTLAMRPFRGELGLITTGSRVVCKLPPSVGDVMFRTLSHDAFTVSEEYIEVTEELDSLLQHVNKIDRTSHVDTAGILSGGLHTMIAQFDQLYSDVKKGIVPPQSDDFASYWQILLDQSRLGVAELISLDHAQDTRTELYTLSASGAARFCAHAIQLSNSAQHLPARTTIGCPISFEPALLRDLWEWYVDLRALQTNSSTQSPSSRAG